MYDLSNICFICLKDINKLETEYLNRTEDAVKQINYVLPEITIDPEIPVHICSTCHAKLHSFCTFKKQCLENYYRFLKKLRESDNAKEQPFTAFQIEIENIKKENQMEDDLINEAPEELDSQINFMTKEDTINSVQDETISLGLNRNINEVSDLSDDIKSVKCEEQYEQTNNLIEDNINIIYIKEERITFEDSEEPKLYQELVPDIKNEIDSEEDINEIENTDLNIKNSERAVSNLIAASDLDQNINEESGIKEKVKSFECSICNQKFTQISDLISHNKMHSGISNLQCYICEKKFKQKCNLVVHIKTHTGIKDFQCSICKKEFIQKNSLNDHMKIHTGIKDFQCSVCEKKFMIKCNLKMHMKIHTGAKNFQCSVCEKKFIQRIHLNDHMKTHTGVKDYQCSVCEKKFTLQSHLNYHMKTHTGVKDFQCSICNKLFTQKSSLNDHMKIHTGIKDFQCSFCEKKFTQRSNLNVHIKIHTDVKDFECNICDKKFIQKNDMSRHMKLHDSIRGFECYYCDKRFIKRKDLVSHMRIVKHL